jgi:hypothetical protein
MAYDRGGLKALKRKPSGGRKRENMTLAEENALLARFTKAAGAGEMLNIHDLKAAYEQAIGHQTSNSTIYNVLARHGWRKLMPRLAFCSPCTNAANESAAMDQVYVGYEPGPFALTLKSDLAVVERLKFRPVRNADDGCCAELLDQEFHQMILAGGIERRCRLIEHNDVRPMNKDPREGKPLLLAAGQHLLPGRILLDVVDQVVKANEFQCPRNLIDIFILSRPRIGDGSSQRTYWNVSTLGHKQYFRAGFDFDPPVAPRP